MKIRILDNSIRLRLSKSEVDQFNDEGEIAARTEFPNGSIFEYKLNKTDIEEMNASFIDGKIELFCPEAVVEKWANSERVGFRNELSLGKAGKLSLLVEKDFKCLDPNREEDESDNFEHPKAKDGATC